MRLSEETIKMLWKIYNGPDSKTAVFEIARSVRLSPVTVSYYFDAFKVYGFEKVVSGKISPRMLRNILREDGSNSYARIVARSNKHALMRKASMRSRIERERRLLCRRQLNEKRSLYGKALVKIVLNEYNHENLRCKEIANAAGMTQSGVHRLAKGQRYPRIEYQRRLCELFRLGVSSLDRILEKIPNNENQKNPEAYVRKVLPGILGKS